MSKSLTGSSFSLAQWFTPAVDISNDQGEFLREDLINDVYQFTAFGVSKTGQVIVHTPDGRCIIEKKTERGCSLVWFDYVVNGRWTHYKFWFNESSVKDLGDLFRKSPEKRKDFDWLYIN